MKKKISLTDKETTSILSQINQEIDNFKNRDERPLPLKYYFSVALSLVIIIILINSISLPLFHQNNKGGDILIPNKENPEEPAKEPQNPVIFDEQYMQLEKIKNELYEHANELERSEYIGYTYSIDQLYHYLLAIHYRDQGLLDRSYKYEYFVTFDHLSEAYQTYVDFSSVTLEELVHEQYQIDITLSYTNRVTNEQNYLNYHLDYSIHQLTDYSTFDDFFENETAFLNSVKISGETVELEVTYANSSEEINAPNGTSKIYSDDSSVTK